LGLPRAVWVLQAGLLVNWLGNGAVGPFLLIYLHEVRGVPLEVAGFVLAAGPAAALAAGPALGVLADRRGARLVLAASLLVSAVAVAALPLVRAPWHAAGLLALAGVGGAGFGTCQSSLVAALVPPRLRPAAFAQQRVSMHAGIGLGGLAGGLVVAVERPESFTVLFLANALSFVVYAALLALVPDVRASPRREAGRYRTVLRNRPFVGFLGLNALVVGAAIVPMASFLPLFARSEAGASEGEIGALAFLGGAVIMAAQLPIATALGGRRRMPTLGAMAALWALALLVVAAGGLGSVALLGVAVVVFAAGQCLHGAVQNPLAADLAEPGSLGRSMALLNGSWQVGLLAGPVAAGFVFAAEPFALWPLAAAACVLAGAFALGLDGSLPEGARTTPRRRLRAATAGAESP
jgi:MFS family permease